MLRKLRTFGPLALFAALLVALGYWNIRPETFLDRPSAKADDTEIDFYADNAHTLQYQPDGKLQYEMTATKLEHVKASDITLVSAPDLMLYRGTDLPWHVRSDRAEVAPGGTQAELPVSPKQKYAQTEKAVRIDAANGVTTANGMKAYLNDNRMTLKSNVRGQYEAR